MNITLELCSVCRRPPGNRIVYRNGDQLICNRECAKESIGLAAWNQWWEVECAHRLDQVTRHSKVKIFRQAK